MRRFIAILFVLVVVVIGVLLVAPNFIPMDVYKTQITQAAERTTGRALTIDGDLKIAFFPRFQIELNDVTFANREGASPEQMATMDQLGIGLEVMPLFRREVVIDRLVLTRPVMSLEIDRNGHGNWEFDMPASAPDADEAGDGGNEDFALNELSLGDVRLVDGDVRFRDRRNGADYHLQDIDLTVSLPTLQGPLGLDGQLTYNGERLNLDTQIDSPRGFIDGEQTPTRIALRSDVVRLDFNGSAATARSGAIPLRAGGDVELNVPSVRALAAWTGSPIESPGGFGPLHVTGRADANGDNVTFNNATLSFDEMNGTGNFAFNLGGTRPRVNGDLALNQVDIRPYMGESTGGSGNRGGGSSEWSTDPIDFSALRALDANLSIVADQVITPTLEFGRSTLEVTLQNGVMTAVIEEMNLYEGSGNARFEVDARNDVAVVREQSTFDLVQALPLFTDLANFRSLEGVGMVSLDVTTRGRSQRDFISALNGDGEIRFRDGALKGINIAQMLRTVGSALTDIEIPRGPQQTDFAELGGTFQIRDGVVTNTDMRLLNPLLRVTGTGSTNLVNRTIDYRINPQAVMTLEGQGSTRDITGATVPLRVTGSWDNLRFGPDIESIGRGFIERQLGIGNQPASGDEDTGEEGTEAQPEEEVDPGEQLLRNLFGSGNDSEDSTTEPAATEEPAATPEESSEEEQPAEEAEEDEEPTPEDIIRGLFGGN